MGQAIMCMLLGDLYNLHLYATGSGIQNMMIFQLSMMRNTPKFMPKARFFDPVWAIFGLASQPEGGGGIFWVPGRLRENRHFSAKMGGGSFRGGILRAGPVWACI